MEEGKPPASRWKDEHNLLLTQHLYKDLTASSQSMEAVRRVLRKLFIYYVSSGDRLNISFIKTSQIYRLLEDASIQSRDTEEREIELCLQKYSNSQTSVDFDVFLTMMFEISELRYSQDEMKGTKRSSKEAFMELYEKHMKPLYANIYMNTEFGEFDTLLQEPIDRNTLRVLWHSHRVLLNIYRKYFEIELQKLPVDKMSLKAYIQKSDHACFNFLTEFDLSPDLIGKNLMNTLFQHILYTPTDRLSNNSDIKHILGDPKSEAGNRLTFSKFITLLARVAMVGYSQKNAERTTIELSTNLTSVQKLLLLLERMEFSKGFIEYERSMNLTHNSKTRLVPPKDVIANVPSSHPDLRPSSSH